MKKLNTYKVAGLLTALSIGGAAHKATAQNIAHGPQWDGVEGSSAQYGFIENKGQVLDQSRKQNKEVAFIKPAGMCNVALRADGYSYQFFAPNDLGEDEAVPRRATADQLKAAKSSIRLSHRIDIRFQGCRQEVEWAVEDQAPDHLNYINEHGEFNLVHHYSTISREELYEGVDLRYKSSYGSPFKYDIVVDRPQDLTAVRFTIEGANAVQKGSELILSAGDHELREFIPESYIVSPVGTREAVQVTYNRASDGAFTFACDRSEWPSGWKLIIDPTPTRFTASFYGGPSGDYLYDAAKGLYMVGMTWSTSNIASTGSFQPNHGDGGITLDAMLIKMASTYCTRNWATYYGGGDWDQANAVTIDPLDNTSAVVVGLTSGSGGIFGSTGAFQPTIAGDYDGFIAKFNSSGGRTWGTYLGGANWDALRAVECNSAGEVFVCGSVSNANMPTPGAHQAGFGGQMDAMWAKFNSTGTTKMYYTNYGGLGVDEAYALKLDGSNLYFGGKTSSSTAIATANTHQPAIATAVDGFVAKFTTAGVRLWGSYYGGSGDDVVTAVGVGFCGVPFIAGETNSTDLTASANAHQMANAGLWDGFLAKFNAANGTRSFGTYFGGPGQDNPTAMTTTGADQLYIVGTTMSYTGIATANSYQPALSAFREGFITRFSSNGTQLWGTYYGGSNQDYIDGCTISGGKLVVVGNGWDPTALADPACYDPTNANSRDGFYGVFDIPSASACQPKMLAGAEYTVLPFPVPSSDYLTIPFDLEEEMTPQMVVSDMLGRIVIDRTLGSLEPGPQQYTFDIGALPSGNYSVLIYVGNDLMRGRFLKN